MNFVDTTVWVDKSSFLVRRVDRHFQSETFSSDETRLLACADCRLLRSGPPLVSVPPMTRPTTDSARNRPEPMSVPQRWR